ncbi:MAG TPA: enoyl-CoA hydratase-related protein [Solirubrobacteraceae bacterium]|nr:enoyl-CoA hydratase-related protein [Solirubrobacteraceae bacterium]
MSQAPGTLVRHWDDEGVGRLCLTDARRRNVLSRAMSDAIADAVEDLVSRDVGAIIVSAEPPVFCAGGSLDGLLSRSSPLSDSYAGQDAIASAPIPTIAAVGGAAIGAGVSLALACDVVLVSPSARFDPRFLDLAIHPGGGHLWRLRRRVGDQGAAALVLCGDTLVGEQAVTAGMAWKCYPDDALEHAAEQLARRAAGRSRALVARTKETLREVARIDDPELAADLELAAQEWSVAQPEFTEAIRTAQERIADRPR